MQSLDAIRRGETPQEREARHAALRAQAQREKKTAPKHAITGGALLGLIPLVLEIVFRALWLGFILLLKGIRWLILGLFRLIRKYPRQVLALIAIAALIKFGMWRYDQGFTSEDIFFLGVGALALAISVWFTYTYVKVKAWRQTYVGAWFMFGGAFLLYLGLF